MQNWNPGDFVAELDRMNPEQMFHFLQYCMKNNLVPNASVAKKFLRKKNLDNS